MKTNKKLSHNWRKIAYSLTKQVKLNIVRIWYLGCKYPIIYGIKIVLGLTQQQQKHNNNG